MKNCGIDQMKAKKHQWREKLFQAMMGYLGIFAGEERFINSHRGNSSMIKEQDRYGKEEK